MAMMRLLPLLLPQQPQQQPQQPLPPLHPQKNLPRFHASGARNVIVPARSTPSKDIDPLPLFSCLNIYTLTFPKIVNTLIPDPMKKARNKMKRKRKETTR